MNITKEFNTADIDANMILANEEQMLLFQDMDIVGADDEELTA